MSNRRIAMISIREILRLSQESKLSARQIAKVLNVSRSIVSQYLSDFKTSGLNYQEIINMPDDAFLDIFEKKKALSSSPKYQKLSEQFSYFTKELKKTGVTLQILWDEYIRQNPEGYSYPQFCFHFHVWRNTSDISMHIEHKAGDKVFVDYTGKKLKIVDKLTVEEKEVEIFVAILGASQFSYVEATESQKKEDWIKSNENAFQYFGGVTRAVVPDNLKSAITKSDKYEPEINPEYADFARHYGTVILPARSYCARDKALVEDCVKIIYTRIFAPLRNNIFYSLEELNQTIKEKLDNHNNMFMQRVKISRKQLFDEIEKSVLLPLPSENYEFKKFLNLKVQFNYHIELREDRHYYSVPFRYIGKQVTVIYTQRSVEIFFNNIRIAIHKREKKFGYTTVSDHMPPSHKFYSEWNPERITNWAEKIGDNVKKVVQEMFQRKQHPEQAFKSCLGLLNLSKKYGDNRLNNACKRVIAFNYYSYKAVKNILERGMDKLEEENQDLFSTLPEHENIRGNTYYN